MTQGFLKALSYPHVLLPNVSGRKCMLYNIQQKVVPCEFIFYVKLLIQATIYTVV